jgi:hypothetical protein
MSRLRARGREAVVVVSAACAGGCGGLEGAMNRTPEAVRISRELAKELGQLPEQVAHNRWRFTAQTDRSEPAHHVEYVAGRLYCTCTGFSVHKHCKHVDRMEKELMNDDDYPMTKDLAPSTATFGGAVAVHRSPTELRARLEEMKAERGLVAAFMKDVMEPSSKGKTDGDYGIIPGTDKPTLFKPGAEKLCELYGYAPTIKSREELIDNESGHYRVVVTIALVQKGTGAVIAEGIGECNTREGRYFYRWGFEKDIPLGVDKASLKTRTGTGRNGRPYTMYRIENDDLFTLWNTVLKMAKKRALVDAVLSATRSSGIFSQSMEQINDWIEAEYEVVGSDDEPEVPAGRDNPADDDDLTPPAPQPSTSNEGDADKRTIVAMLTDCKQTWGAKEYGDLFRELSIFMPDGEAKFDPKAIDGERAAACVAYLRERRGEAVPA